MLYQMRAPRNCSRLATHPKRVASTPAAALLGHHGSAPSQQHHKHATMAGRDLLPVLFILEINCQEDEAPAIVGPTSESGEWPLVLKPVSDEALFQEEEYETWAAEVLLPADQEYQFNFVLVDTKQSKVKAVLDEVAGGQNFSFKVEEGSELQPAPGAIVMVPPGSVREKSPSAQAA